MPYLSGAGESHFVHVLMGGDGISRGIFLTRDQICIFCIGRIILLTTELPESENESEVVQSCLTLCDPMDCSPPGSSIHGILQARILEWVTIPFSRASSGSRD